MQRSEKEENPDRNTKSSVTSAREGLGLGVFPDSREEQTISSLSCFSRISGKPLLSFKLRWWWNPVEIGVVLRRPGVREPHSPIPKFPSVDLIWFNIDFRSCIPRGYIHTRFKAKHNTSCSTATTTWSSSWFLAGFSSQLRCAKSRNALTKVSKIVKNIFFCHASFRVSLNRT